jgi:hypothetical protein
MKRMGLARAVFVAASMSIAFGTASAWAEAPTTLCMKKSANGAVKGPTVPGGNTCKAGYNAIQLPGAGELETLNKILPYIKYVENGVAGKPTIQFSGVNAQVVNGEGTTESVNGKGNLVIGYDESPGTQTGSHNLILGGIQSFSSVGGIVAGLANTITEPYASVTGGFGNIASGIYSSVGGGANNKASAAFATVDGGEQNKASGQAASVSGGSGNTASGGVAVVSGGFGNTANKYATSVTGGLANVAGEAYASVTGGNKNTASGNSSSVTGGSENTASVNAATVSGGEKNTASEGHSSVSGGYKNSAEGKFSSIFGSKELKATLEFEARPSCVLGGPPRC